MAKAPSESTENLLNQISSSGGARFDPLSPSSSLRTEDVVRIAVAIGCISKGIADHGLIGSVRRNRPMAVNVVQETKEWLEIVDQVFQ